VSAVRSPIFCAVLLIILCCLSAVRADAQQTYEYSNAWYDASTNTAWGYSSTEIDYYCEYDYSAYVEGYLYNRDETVVSSGWDEEPDIAEVYTSVGASPGASYTEEGYHDVVERYYREVIDRSPDGCWPCDGCNTDCYYFQDDYYWYDPFGFSFISPGYYGPWWDIYGYGPATEVEDDEYDDLGETFAFVSIAPRVDSVSPDRALVGQPVDVVIRGAGFGGNPSVSAGAGISVTVNSVSDAEIHARFNIAANDSGGNHAVTVTASSGMESNPGGNFFVQIPAGLSVLSKGVFTGPGLLANGCPANQPFGFRVSISYQVLDQSGAAINFGMPLRENLVNFTVDGQSAAPDVNNGLVTASGLTETNGTFLDQPVGGCADGRFNTGSFTQELFTPLNSSVQPTVRINDWVFSGRSGCGNLTNGNDVSVTTTCP
jgi:hypothetical protein